MAISHSLRRGDPDALAPGTFRADAVRLVVQAAREMVSAMQSDDGVGAPQAAERLCEAVRVLDVLEGKS